MLLGALLSAMGVASSKGRGLRRLFAPPLSLSAASYWLEAPGWAWLGPAVLARAAAGAAMLGRGVSSGGGYWEHWDVMGGSLRGLGALGGLTGMYWEPS